MQPNTTAEKNIQQIKRGINKDYNKANQELNLGVDSGYSKSDWRGVLEFQNWSALRILKLGNKITTQLFVAFATLVLNWWAICPGPIFNY